MNETWNVATGHVDEKCRINGLLYVRKSVGSSSIEFKPLATLCSSSDRCVKNVHCILRQDNKSKTVVSSSSSFSFFEKIPLKNALRIRTTIRPFKPQHNRQSEKKIPRRICLEKMDFQMTFNESLLYYSIPEGTTKKWEDLSAWLSSIQSSSLIQGGKHCV